MLNHSKTGLSIFDNVRIDFNLPKWKDKLQEANKLKETGGIIYRRNYTSLDDNNGPNMVSSPIGASTFIVPDMAAMPTVSGEAYMGASGSAVKKENKIVALLSSIFQRRKIADVKKAKQEEANKTNFKEKNMTPDEWWSEKQAKEIAEHEKQVTLTVADFFASIKGNTENLELAMERYQSYEKVLDHLRLTGQTAIYETMCLDFEIHVAESKLFGIGFNKLITETNVIEFAKKAPRTVKLDWIANFTRAIPEKVVEIKVKLDAAKIFDNYVIMHYDPKSTSNKTAEEKSADEKDPILFGIIAGRQKLYYVADWIDDYCDLTFDKLVEVLGEEAVNANNLTANIKMVTDNNN